MRRLVLLVLLAAGCAPVKVADERLDRIEDLCREAVRTNQTILSELGEIKAAQARLAEGQRRFAARAAVARPSAPSHPGPPDPDVVYAVPLGVAPGRGAVEPKVTIVEFSDFQCPFCKRVDATLQQILKRYPNDVRHVYRHNPLPFHPNAMPAAIAAEAARRQGRFWELYDLLFANARELSDAKIDELAASLQLSMKRFHADLADPKSKALVEADMAVAQEFGARGTPTFFINGRVLTGSQPFESFRKIIDAEIERADALLAKGVARKDLYRELTQDGQTGVN